MLTKVTSILLLPVLAVSVFCQGTQINAVAGVPGDVVCRFFFQKVLWLDGQAGGQGPVAMRSVVQQQAALTSHEAATLTSAAKDWKSKDIEINRSLSNLAAQGATADSPQVQSLSAQAKQNVLDHVNQLQTSFGPGRFYLLDLYVRRSMNITGPGVTPSTASPGH